LRTHAVVLLALVLASCSVFGGGAGQTLPPANASPQVGVAYRVTLYCALPVEVGSTWWQFDKSAPWPPALPRGRGMSPYPVPGLITISSSTTAVFRADVDGSSLAMTKLAAKPPLAGCI